MTDPVAPTGVDHVAINVPDVPGGIAFYTEKIGLVQNFTRPDFGFAGAWLDTANGQQVHLIEAAVPDNVGQHFALAFDDLGAAVAELRARGLEVSDPVAVGDDRAPAGVHGRPVGQRDRAAPAPPEHGAVGAGLGESVRTLTCLRPRRSPNFTTPSAVAKSVSSPPRPTFTPGVDLRPPLAHQDGAGGHRGAVEPLHAEALGVRVAAVAGGPATLGLGHVALLGPTRPP